MPHSAIPAWPSRNSPKGVLQCPHEGFFFITIPLVVLCLREVAAFHQPLFELGVSRVV
jgi:hypothetical protein